MCDKQDDKCIDNLLGLGLGLEFPYVITGEVYTYPHYFQDKSNLYPIKS